MNTTITKRLSDYRALLAKHGVAAAVVPQADPHQSEYLAPHWQVRRYLSGFTGSAGDLVVLPEGAALWTDSRYFLQAAQQLEGTGIELMKDGLDGTPSIADYLTSNLKPGDTVGIDGMLFNSGTVADLRSRLEQKGISLKTDLDIIDEMWADRPSLPSDPIFIHDIRYAGESASEKIGRILADARANGADSVFESMLDNIAWTLNIRSNDVNHTPVATAFLYLSEGCNVLFIDPAKLTDETVAYLASQHVETRPYGDVKGFLANVGSERVLVAPSQTAMQLLDILGDRVVPVTFSGAGRFKAVKNEVQIEGLRAAMRRDGAAMVRSIMEIEHRLATGIPTGETDIAEILRRQRAKGEGFTDESFGTIAGYGPHGAIVHYEATAESSLTLEPHGLLLIDSGAQYPDGTTDITRTIALGTPTAEERRDFTLVMKGHIALAKAVFPAGTRGAQLDVLARQYLWQNGLSYLHGTGHGVGHFLGVHEGPHSIRLNYVDFPLLPGSITSNEPGLYRENVHGIRCENLVLCRHKMTTEFGEFLCLETLTLCPWDRSLFDLSLMTPEETAWVDSYHAMVAERLMPLMETEEERAWLKSHTQPLEA